MNPTWSRIITLPEDYHKPVTQNFHTLKYLQCVFTNQIILTVNTLNGYIYIFPLKNNNLLTHFKTLKQYILKFPCFHFNGVQDRAGFELTIAYFDFFSVRIFEHFSLYFVYLVDIKKQLVFSLRMKMFEKIDKF